ncbi:hypothetical protein AB4Y85_17815 [Microvirga sp. 2YAF29]|uniref:hypothetical protein n=1 Tax=Microvirga sp. 2YAF29 TaxID=3233031 RepID=UPI003F96889C
MTHDTLDNDKITALTRFSVGTLDECEAMMVLEVASIEDDPSSTICIQIPMAMTPFMAQSLGNALLTAAEALKMGACVSHLKN